MRRRSGGASVGLGCFEMVLDMGSSELAEEIGVNGIAM